MSLTSAVLFVLIVTALLLFFGVPTLALYLTWRVAVSASSREARTDVKINTGGESAARQARGGSLRRVEGSRGIDESEAV